MKTFQEYEASRAQGILLNANENNLPMRPEIRAAVMENLAKTAFNRYPDDDETELRSAYGKVAGIDPDMILAGNGSDQMLGHLIGTFLGRGKILYTLDPDFSMYDYYASSYEASVQKFDINADGTFDIEAFIREGQNADLVMFSNPNNPTGHCYDTETIAKILEGFRIPVVIDEAYIEFAGQQSSISLLDRFDNLYVTRTLSKAYGMAGIRIGFAVSSKENMKRLRSRFVPYAVNSLSMAAACAVLQFPEMIREDIRTIKAERERVYAALSAMDWLQAVPSQTNFIYCTSRDKEQFLDILEKENIVIRNYAGSDAFRISIGTKEENDAILNAAEKMTRRTWL